MNDKNPVSILAELRRLHRDDYRYEAKECARNLSGDVWESVSAFANTQGGVLLLGVSEENGFTPVEGFAIDRVCDQFVAGMGDGGEPGRKTAQAPQGPPMQDALPAMMPRRRSRICCAGGAPCRPASWRRRAG